MKCRAITTWLAAATMALAMAWSVAATTAQAAQNSQAPSQLTIGTLYAGSGQFAVSSKSEYSGLKFWIKQMNDNGGVYVKAYDQKIPLKLVSYNDQSSTTTAATLYNRLITQDKVDILTSDFGSVLTSVVVPLAQEHQQLLFDVSGTGGKFFSKDNPYIVLTSLPTSAVWPRSLAAFLNAKPIKNVAILYDANDFDQSQAQTLRKLLKKKGNPPIYYKAVPTDTSNYTVLLHSIKAKNPNAVIEFGYANNDIAFLKALAANDMHFPMVFTVFPGQLLQTLRKNVGPQGMAYSYTYPTPPLLKYNDVGFGLGIDDFQHAYQKATGKTANFLTVAGYNAGLVIQKTLATAPKLTQMAMRHAVAKQSGNLFTLDGHFKIRDDGAQIGEALPVAQFQPQKGQKNNQLVIVYPQQVATGKADYPAPNSN